LAFAVDNSKFFTSDQAVAGGANLHLWALVEKGLAWEI
jgi:hypothetical protein